MLRQALESHRVPENEKENLAIEEPVMTQVRPHGLHHVTAIATDPQSNVDFYTRALGLRLVKQTVNFDAPETYHLYYGDERGTPVQPAHVLSLAGRPAGRQGAGMTTATAFSVPGASLGWWHERFRSLRIDVGPAAQPRPRTRCSPSGIPTAS